MHHAAILIALPAVIGVGLIFGVGFPPVYDPIVGLASGLAVGNVIGILKTAWPTYRIAHLASTAWKAAKTAHALPGRRARTRGLAPGRHTLPIPSPRSAEQTCQPTPGSTVNTPANVTSA